MDNYGTVEPGISKLFQKHKKFTIARCLLSKGFDQNSNTGTVEPGISKLFQKHKKFTIAMCLLSKGFDQNSNIGIISALYSSYVLNIYYFRVILLTWFAT